MKPISRAAAPAFVCDLLQRRATLSREDLSARGVAKALGQTTGFLYHHWGSFDDFLFEVSGLGWKRLVDSVVRAWQRTGDPRSLVRAYVAFAAAHPVLYSLLAERPLPRDTVRALLEGGGALPSYAAFQRIFALVSQAEPGMSFARARALHAAAHGLASQLLSGRLGSTPDTVGKSERAVADELADEITAAFFSARSRAPRSPARDRTAAPPPRRRKTGRAASSSRRS